MRVFVTGGAGFIGRHLVDALVGEGHEVRVLDNLEPRVHPAKPGDLNPAATYFWNDIRDREAVQEAGKGAEALFHLASLIEVAEGERAMGRYVDVNARGTAVLLDTLREGPALRRLILTSSVAVYGEGAHRCPQCGSREGRPRTQEQVEDAEWDLRCTSCGASMEAEATSEGQEPRPRSVYGLTKLVQEKMFQALATHREIPAVILRYANVFGPGQRGGAYAGVCTAFLNQARAGEPLTVHEDGRQMRDFVFVEDAVRATVLALRAEIEGTAIANIGTGHPTSIIELAEVVGDLVGFDLPPVVGGTYRPGDVRHLWVDSRTAREVLGFAPTRGLRDGLREMLSLEARNSRA